MHRHNRKAFSNVDANHRLVRLYMRLVALELTLKDRDHANYTKSHDIFLMIGDLKNIPNPGVLTPLSTALATSLNALHCTMKDGSPGHVTSKIYPGMRYLRHVSDFSGTTTDNDLDTANSSLDELLKELKQQGILP